MYSSGLNVFVCCRGRKSEISRLPSRSTARKGSFKLLALATWGGSAIVVILEITYSRRVSSDRACASRACVAARPAAWPDGPSSRPRRSAVSERAGLASGRQAERPHRAQLFLSKILHHIYGGRLCRYARGDGCQQSASPPSKR